VGHLGPDQVDRARDYFLQDRVRCIRVRHPPAGVMFSNSATLPPYVLRDVLLSTTQQSQSIRQTHSETMGCFTFKKLSLDEVPTKLIIDRRVNRRS